MPFVQHMTSRNPVWMVPLALPIVLYASQSLDLAITFGIAVALVVPAVHSVSFFAERALPREVRLLPVLVLTATLITVWEMLILRFGVELTGRSAFMLEGITVSALVLSPTVAAPERESYAHRMKRAAGLSVGFLLGFVPVVVLRVLLGLSGYQYANSLFVGFLLLAVGRIAINLVRRRHATETGGR